MRSAWKWWERGRVDGDEAALVLEGEPGAAEAGVDRAGRLQLAVAVGGQELVLAERVGEPLHFLKDEPAVVHASGGEEVDHGRLGAPAVDLGLERPLGLDGVADVGGHHRVDVGGEDGEGGKRPEGRDEDEAALAAAAAGAAGAGPAGSGPHPNPSPRGGGARRKAMGADHIGTGNLLNPSPRGGGARRSPPGSALLLLPSPAGRGAGGEGTAGEAQNSSR